MNNPLLLPNSILKHCTANDWLKHASVLIPPKMLCDSLWFENEICIAYGDSNVGKSVFAIQLANAISNGQSFSGITIDCQSQKVIYIDFEMSSLQMLVRYSCDEGIFQFSDLLIRAELDPDKIEDGKLVEECILNAIEGLVVETQARIIVIDNLTFLSADHERAKEALSLMKKLKKIKASYCLSMLILAHCPKRSMQFPITKNDLAGSAMILNFADSAFAFGKSATSESVRYIKQIKSRNSAIIYGTDKVCLFEIIKVSNFLCFSFKGYACERDLLKVPNDEGKEALSGNVLSLSKAGKSQREVSRLTGLSLSKVNRLIRSSQGSTPIDTGCDSNPIKNGEFEFGPDKNDYNYEPFEL